MIAGHVYRTSNGFHVSLTRNGEELDDAGPFDDEIDATDAARRMADEVYTCRGGVSL